MIVRELLKACESIDMVLHGLAGLHTKGMEILFGFDALEI
jgi:hypothetical protein